MKATSVGRIRAAAAAGRFYPAEPKALLDQVTALLADVPACNQPAPKALIAPHAGYVYSGPVAASIYARLIPDRELIRRVVLLGPSHFTDFAGVATSTAEAFLTPLGPIPVDQEAVNKISALPFVLPMDEAHAPEHSLEVHLPFLQVILPSFVLVPLLAGVASAEEISEVLELLWDGAATRLVVSSDLSHYLDASSARQMDRETANNIEAFRVEEIGEGQACGRVLIRGLLRAAGAHGLKATTVDLRNSGDTAGPRDHVVGYGAFAFG